jgi:hypothetical protein
MIYRVKYKQLFYDIQKIVGSDHYKESLPNSFYFEFFSSSIHRKSHPDAPGRF